MRGPLQYHPIGEQHHKHLSTPGFTKYPPNTKLLSTPQKWRPLFPHLLSDSSSPALPSSDLRRRRRRRRPSPSQHPGRAGGPPWFRRSGPHPRCPPSGICNGCWISSGRALRPGSQPSSTTYWSSSSVCLCWSPGCRSLGLSRLFCLGRWRGGRSDCRGSSSSLLISLL